MSLFDIAICTIFARESLEGSVIVGQYRTAILRSYEEIENGADKVIKDDIQEQIVLLNSTQPLIPKRIEPKNDIKINKAKSNGR